MPNPLTKNNPSYFKREEVSVFDQTLGGEPPFFSCIISQIDSDDDDDLDELADRLQGVDLDDANQVWLRLSKSERRQFTELLEKGDVNSLLPEFKPWWEQVVQAF